MGKRRIILESETGEVLVTEAEHRYDESSRERKPRTVRGCCEKALLAGEIEEAKDVGCLRLGSIVGASGTNECDNRRFSPIGRQARRIARGNTSQGKSRTNKMSSPKTIAREDG